MTCDKPGAGDWQPVGLSVATVNNCAPMLAAAVSRERAKGKCWHEQMVWAAFLPQVQVFAGVRSTRARAPVPILELGAMRYGRFGGPIPVWVSNYVCVAT